MTGKKSSLLNNVKEMYFSLWDKMFPAPYDETRRELFRLTGIALGGAAIAAVTIACGQSANFMDGSSPTQGSSQQATELPHTYDSHEALDFLSNRYVSKLFEFMTSQQNIHSDEFSNLRYLATDLTDSPHYNEYIKIEEEIRKHIGYAVSTSEIILKPGTDVSGFTDAYLNQLAGVASSFLFDYIRNFEQESLRLGARMLLSFSPLDILIDAADVVRGEVQGLDAFGYPVNDIDKILNAGFFGFSILSGGTIGDLPDDANDINRAIKYLYRAGQGQNTGFYLVKGQEVVHRFHDGTKIVQETIGLDQFRQVLKSTLREENLQVIGDLGTGKKVVSLEETVGNVGRISGNYNNPLVLTFDPDPDVWKAILENPEKYVEEVRRAKVIGLQEAVTDLNKLLPELEMVRAYFPNRGLAAMFLDTNVLSTIYNSGKPAQITFNFTPMVMPFVYKNAPDTWVRFVAGIEGMEEIIPGLKGLTNYDDQMKVIGDFISEQRPHKIKDGVSYIGPQYMQFVDKLSPKIPEYFNNSGAVTLARRLESDEAGRISTHFAGIAGAEGQTLPQYIVEIIR